MRIKPKSRQLEAQYRHIEAWGRMLGSMDYYIRDQQTIAAREGAPLDAVYKGGGDWETDRKWVTIKDCHVRTQQEIAAILERLANQKDSE